MDVDIAARYGKLVVVRFTPSCKKSGNKMVLCVCDCGNTTTVSASNLRVGKTRSCGCNKVIAAATATKAATKHGMHGTKIYAAWNAMLNRCRLPASSNYKDYGGRGVTVCDRWKKFENFYADMGDCPTDHSLDRIDVNGNYEPGNVRWATDTAQRRNKRNTRYVDYQGQTRCIRDWEDALGLPVNLLWMRLRRGWSVEAAFTTPYRKEKARFGNKHTIRDSRLTTEVI